MGIIDENYIKEYVKNNLWQLDRRILKELAENLDINFEDKTSKEDIVNYIISKDNVDYMALYNKHKSSAFAITGGKMAELLNVDINIVKKMAKKNWLTIPYKIEQVIHGRVVNVSCYSLEELLSLTTDDIKDFLEKKVKPLTEKQKEALERGRITSIKNRTCCVCNRVVGKKSYLTEGLCRTCINNVYEQSEKDYVRLKFQSYLEDKEKFVILDTETTGLNYDDKIIEIAIIDLDGNVLLNTLVNTDKEISYEASTVNSINKEMLIGKPTILDLKSKLDAIFKNRTVLIYNAAFDTRMLYQSGYEENIKSECIMELYSKFNITDRWISLSMAMIFEDIDEIQNHRALGDCKCVLELIKKIANE